jgi:phosphatidylserine/phosphatidylglycerophosphate/cardiolipin synthase-like enzyme
MKLTIIFLILILLLSGCVENQTGMLVSQELNITETSEPMEVYFCPDDQCREHLLSLLKNANNSIHCAFFDLDIPEIIDTLKQRQMNIDVKLVIDERNSNESSEINHVENSGKGGLMHNKFCVIDGNTVFTGSFNPTENDNFYNNNNIVIVYSKYIADNYENEFQELWNKKFAHGEKVKYPIVYLNDKQIENYFCPEDSCSTHVIENLKEAKNEVYFLAFSFTHDGIGKELINLHNEGIKIQGVFEKTGSSEFSEYYNLNNSIDVKWDEYKYIMHHKVFIIDNKTVITGSFNPTESADESNDENVLIIHDENIAQKYLEEFDRIWNFEDKLDTTEKKANSILISEVYYDCAGKDEEEEFIELYNPTNQDLNLDYYFISNSKNNQRLDGIIKSNTTNIIKPKFSLSNKGGYIVLKRCFDQVDFVSWESIWNLEAKTGKSLQRKNFEKVNSIDQWTVGSPNPEELK